MKNLFKKYTVFLLFFALLFAPCNSIAAEVTDTTGPTVDFATLTVSKSEIQFGEAVKLSFKVEDESDIAEVYCNVVQSNGDLMGCGIERDLESGIWTFSYTPNYYGTCEIMDISVSDANGNVTRYVNSAYSRYGEGMYDWDNENNIDIDMSSANFEVIGGNGNDAAGPTIVMDSIAVDKTQVSVNDSFKLQFVVEDDSDIAEIYLDMMQANGQLMGAGIEKDVETGKWIYTFAPNYVGLVEIAGIKIIDAYGNVTRYINSFNSRYGEAGYDWGDASALKVDLSRGNVEVRGGKVGDVTGPEIALDTLSVDELQIKVHECSNISFKIVDESEIGEVYCNVTQGNGSLMGYGIQFDINTGVWTFSYTPDYYGEVEIQSVEITDTNGNETVYVNSAHSKYGQTGYDWGDENSILTDLSAANFYVGIRDDETGIFVSGSDVTEDTTLDVEEKEFEGTDYDKMNNHSHKHDGDKHHHHKPHGYYDIHVKDHHNGGNKFKVFFDVPWAKDGEMVRVSHMKHDGTIQIEDLPAKNGKVCMEVTEFSPFLVEQIIINNTSDTNPGGTQDNNPNGTQDNNPNGTQGDNTNGAQDNNAGATQNNNSSAVQDNTQGDASSDKNNTDGITSPKTGDSSAVLYFGILVAGVYGVVRNVKKIRIK